MMSRLRVAVHALLGHPIISGVTFNQPPDITMQGGIIRGCTFTPTDRNA